MGFVNFAFKETLLDFGNSLSFWQLFSMRQWTKNLLYQDFTKIILYQNYTKNKQFSGCSILILPYSFIFLVITPIHYFITGSPFCHFPHIAATFLKSYISII